MSMHVLGFNCFMEDASAALLRDGELVAAVQEERFTRIKHDGCFPRNAICKCLEIGRSNPPAATLTTCRKHAEPDVAICGHVVHAELVGDFVQAEVFCCGSHLVGR